MSRRLEGLQVGQRLHDLLLHLRLMEIAEMAAGLEEPNVATAERARDPVDVVGAQQKVVAIGEQPDLPVALDGRSDRAQVGGGDQVAGILDGVGRALQVVGKDERVEVLHVRGVERLLVRRRTPTVRT